MKLEHIKDLMIALDKSNLSELIIKDGDTKLVLKKESATTPAEFVTAQSSIAKTEQIILQEKPVELAETSVVSEKNKNADIYYVESPLVGTFYRASSPEAAPYVEVGSVVKKGDVLCIIEAMKIMNAIESEVSGVVEAIYVESAHFVEYKSKILAIKKS